MQTFTQTELNWVANVLGTRSVECFNEAQDEEHSALKALLTRHGEKLESIALRLRAAVEHGDKRIAIEK